MSKYHRILNHLFKKRSFLSAASIATASGAFSYQLYQHQQHPLFLCEDKPSSVFDMLKSDSYENVPDLSSSMIYLDRGDAE